MQYEKKFFGNPQNGGGDFDSAFFSVGPNNWINAENVRTLTTDAGQVNTLEGVGANVLIPNSYFYVPGPSETSTNIYLGGALDEPNNRIIYFVWNNLGFGRIFCFEATTNTIYKVLLEEQVTGGFGWDKDKFIHSTRVVNGCVYWTDDLNEPRRVNINAGIKANHPGYVTTEAPYTIPLSQSVVAWIRRQPGLPPTAAKITQTSPSIAANLIASQALTFSYRYTYRDFELSTLSGQSLLMNYNGPGETANRIDIFIPFGEQIDQDVIQIDIVAKYLTTGGSFIVHSWRKDDPAQATEIANHNAGTTQLQYKFYNDQVGIALDLAYANKIFDSVPLRASTMEVAKNRSFLADYLIGYTTPLITSLSISTTSVDFNGSGGTITGEWYLLKYITPPPGLHTMTVYVLFTTNNFGGHAPTGTYWYTWNSPVPPFPLSVNDTDLTYRGASSAELLNSFGGWSITGYTDQGASSVIVASITPPSAVLATAFKSNASYQLSISFKDNYGRECGILTNATLLFLTPDTGISTYTYITAVNWLLSNANALNEIPDWAYYYSINITKCLRTRFFVQSLGIVIYAAKDTSNNYTFTTTAYSQDLAGVAIDLTFLNTHAQGYVFSEGDIVELYVNGSIYTMSIIDQSAQWIICQLTDIGSLVSQTGIFEIYTPYKRQANEPYFEVSQIFAVMNPGTNTRSYTALSGTIGGDIYIFSRTNASTNYFTEAMSPNDKYYKDWFTNAGRPNFIDYIGQVTKYNSYCFSNTFIPGTKSNGLSTFDALDTGDIYPECGPIQKLQLTSKVEGELGNIMLAICTKETASMYLGETQLVSATNNAFVAQATGVVGTINVLKGSFGTLHPESVVEFRGNVFFFSVLNGKYIQYSANGLFPISNYKATRFWKLFSEQLMSLTNDEIEALGSRPFVFSTVDPNNWELLVSVPRVLQNPPKGYLPDYPATIYPFDIWDGQAKTMVYKINAEPNHWSGAYSFSPEGLISIQNKTFSFKNANIYQHNTDIFPCTYYGVPQKARIMFLGNQVSNRPKVYNNASVEGNMRPSLVYFRVEPGLLETEQFDLTEQASDLLDVDFELKEGQLYAAIYRNKLQPTAEGFNMDGLLTGERIRALTLLVLSEFEQMGGPLELRYFNLGYQLSIGHTT